MLTWLAGLLDRAFAVVCALVFAQAPLFMQAYTQQLIGRTAELHLQVNAMQQAAGLSNKTLEQLIQKFMQNPDLDVVRQGEVMQGLVGRWHQLSGALSAMQESTLWGRPFAFLFHLNADVFHSTFHEFHLGLPLNLEGGIYALLGLAFGYLLFMSIKILVKKVTMRNFFSLKIQS